MKTSFIKSVGKFYLLGFANGNVNRSGVVAIVA